MFTVKPNTQSFICKSSLSIVAALVPTRSTTPRWQTQSSHRTLSKTYAKQFSKEHLWPTLADRNGFQYAQTQSWQRPSCKKSSQPDSRNPSSCTNPQPDDSQAYNLCSIQSMTVPNKRQHHDVKLLLAFLSVWPLG